MKRLLVISYYWPPTGGSGVQRWVKFCKYLPQMGWQPVVYTPENPERQTYDESLLGEIPPEVEVIRRRIFEPYDLYRKLAGRGSGQAEVNPLNSQKKSLKQKISLWIRGNLFIPDPRVAWVRPSVRFLKKYLAEHPVDAVVTTGPPQSMHLIGLGLKKALGVRWIADFRDPWTEAFWFKHMGACRPALRRQYRLEKDVLDGADLIISVSPLVQRDFQKKTSTPVELITNGFDEDDYKISIEHKPDRFIVAQTGQLAADGNPVCLWNALGRLCREDALFAEKMELRLSGQIDSEVIQAVRDCGLEKNLTLPGYLPHQKIIGEQLAADLLVMPLRREPEGKGIVPGKIFEYIAAGHPVLGIGQEDGASAMILSQSGAGRMFDWDKEDLMYSFVRECWSSRQSGDSFRPATDVLQYSRRTLTQKLTEIL